MNYTSVTGQRGEQAVVDRLRAEGCLIMERNWRSGRYEIDIIAIKEGCIRFVEVKTRSASNWNRPEDSIVASKRRSMRNAARAFMAHRYAGYEFRFDLAAVEPQPDGSCRIDYYEDILQSGW